MSYGYPGYPPPPPQQNAGGGSKMLWIILGLLGGGALLTCMCCGGGIFWAVQAPAVSAKAKEPFPVASVPPPAFPERGAATPSEPGIQRFQISLGPGGGYPTTPGHGGKLLLYLPAGNHAPGSLPCVLITGAGSPLFYGMSLSDGDSDEHLPYVRAGMAVVAYELDGPFDEESEDEAAMKRAYQAFRAAQAGVVNGRNALEFVLARVPEVDPKKIYAAGHSSAATAALLLAEHEPRLAGCMAYAPCYDLPQRLTSFGVRGLSLILPQFSDFAVQSSPRTHEARLNCPVFLFHAEDDSNVPCEDSRAAERRLKALGKDVTLVTVPTGDHYDSMIEQGIPRAIQWLKQR
jgi:dienelactone hydrolase